MEQRLLKSVAKFSTVLLLLLCSSGIKSIAQVMPLPPHSSVWSSWVRGYWFTSPTTFTITGLKVMPEAGTGLQYIHIFKINDLTPVLFPTTSTNFTTLAYISGAPNNVMQTVSIPVAPGDIIGILGSAGTGVSYSATSPFSTTIGGFTTTLSRLVQQADINVVQASNYTTEATGSLGRIEMTYTTTPITCPSPTTLTSGTITSTSAILNWTQTGSTPLGWQIKYGAPGFNPATAGTSIYTTTKPYTLSGLTTATTYDYYVRAVCAVADTSTWSPVHTFNTLCNSPTIVSKKDSSRCGTGTVTLEAVSSAGGNIKWYTSASGGTPIATGNSFTTPSISTTTTYYISAAGGNSSSTESAGIPAIVPGYSTATYYSGNGIYFTTSQPNTTFNSVNMYIQGSGTINIEVRSGIGVTSTQIFTTAIPVTGLGYATPVVVPLNVPLPTAGTYIINLLSWSGSITGTAYKTTGLTYPYNSPNVSVFTGLWGATTYTQSLTSYFYFYNPTFTIGQSCESPRQAIVATVKTLPEVNLGNDTTICPNVTYTFNAGNPGSTYLWTNGATTQTITTTNAGSFGVQVTAANGCVSTDNITITQGINPVNVLPAITNLCDGSTASLNAGNTGSTFLWSPNGQATQTINETDGGIYSVAIKSVDGCKITSETNVTIRPLPIDNLGNDTSICDGANIPLDAGNPGYAYQWSIGATSQVINVSDSGLYTVVVTTTFNCTNEDGIHISYLPSPRVEGFNFIPQFYENLGQVMFSPLNPSNVNSYLWDFGDGSQTSSAVNSVHTYTTAGNFIVTLKVFNGCGDFDISLPINVDLTTGIVSPGKIDAELLLYPNPAQNIINIENKSGDVKMQELNVFNILGANVHSAKANSGNKHQFSVAHLTPGIYTVRILTNKGFVVRKFEVLK